MIKINSAYKPRPVRFLEVYRHSDWLVKIYSISIRNEFVNESTIEYAKQQLSKWLHNSNCHTLDNYKLATLILHEGKEGCFAIINWWVDENMLQHFVYLAKNEEPTSFELYSDNGIIVCVWEMAVLWFERNAWVENILMQASDPDVNAYLNTQLNGDI